MADIKRENLEITIYNQDLGLVKDRRLVTLGKGENELIWSEVSQQIDPTSVHYMAEESWVLEQNYQYDLVSRQVLLSKYIGHEVTIVRQDRDGEEIERYSGTVLSVENNEISSILVEGQVILDPKGQVVLPKLPAGLLVRPTLVFKLNGESDSEHVAQISYLTKGMTWKADYIMVLDKDDTTLSLNGWVTVTNQSGATYPNAQLKLVAGNVNLAKEEVSTAMLAKVSGRGLAAPPPQFEESELFEYHLYTMQHPTTIKQKETKQVSFINANDINCRKLFVYDPTQIPVWLQRRQGNQSDKQQVMVKIEVENSKEAQLGLPLPKGKMRIYKEDETGALQFIGEDLIDHTSRDEKFRLYVGDAFDVVGERIVANSKQSKRILEQTIHINLRNHKDEDIEVVVVEHFTYANWAIQESNHDYEKVNANKVDFLVNVPARENVTIQFSFRAWW